MTEREAIEKLALLTATIAQRCWEALGTDAAGRIATECIAIAHEFGSDPETP